MTDKRPVLVTGGAGFIGSHAVLALLDDGWPVVVLDNLSTGFRSAVPDGVAFVEGDVGDRTIVGRTLADQEIGAIMHFAGSLSVPESVGNPVKYYRNNTANSQALVETAIQSGVRHMLFSSTCAVYGVPDRLPITEDSPTNPINPYGASKLMTERMLADCSTAGLIKTCRLRYFNVAGADPAGRAGQRTLGTTQLIKAAVEAALGKRDSITIFGNDYGTPDGTGVRDYIHVSDLADAHVRAIARLIDEDEPDLLLNCGYGRGFSVHEVLDSVERVSGRSLDRRIAERRPGDPPALVAANGRITEALDWRPRYADLDTIVAHALTWESRLDDRGEGEPAVPAAKAR